MAYFGEGHGPIHLDNIECSGMEDSLGQCATPDTRIHSCWHSEDAGVICDYVEEKVQDFKRTGDIPISSMQESGVLFVGSLHAFVVFPCHSCLWLKLHLWNKHVLSCTSYVFLVFGVSSQQHRVFQISLRSSTHVRPLSLHSFPTAKSPYSSLEQQS